MKRFSSIPVLILLASTTLASCGPRELTLPQPRPLIVSSGARIAADEDRLRPVYEWVNREIENIDLDPSFLVSARPTSTDVLPWETLEITGDTVSIQFRRSAPDVSQVYQLYAHMHLMHEMGRLEEWVPEAVGLDEWGREFAFLKRTTDAWLLGRASFDFAPYLPLDAMMYADQAGLLEDYILTLRGWEFPDVEDAWRAERPDAEEQVRTWYRETFGEDLRTGL